ncbi:alanine racemase [Mesorhizobium sp. M0060]|uniref:alanine racemase n=1 Tax=Mesorhizobium sp. M0060 TaxID=2956866 RepID=UPI00333AB731
MTSATLGGHLRGMPAAMQDGTAAELVSLRLDPAAGQMSLPLLTLDEAVFDSNAKAFFGFAVKHGLGVFPHLKTSMAPSLALRLLAAGADGMTVADARQAAVLLSHGITRVMLANQIGGRGAALRLATLLARYPKAELTVFVDSTEGLAALADAWRDRADLPRLGIAVEVGRGRGGVRSRQAAQALIDAVLNAGTSGTKGLYLEGVAAYEGAAALPGFDAPAVEASIAELLDRLADAAIHARARMDPARSLIVTAGGSAYFHLVVHLAPVIADLLPARLVLRSGALFFHDHGIYARAMAAMTRRNPDGPSGSFRPALKLWAEVLSRPEPGLAILGFGMRDAPVDQGLPVPLQLHRDGRLVAAALAGCTIDRLNDQHAFMSLPPATELAVGDIVSLGISHPCTCIDRWRLVWGVGPDGRVSAVHPTYFG